jgi:hypothetical protein
MKGSVWSDQVVPSVRRQPTATRVLLALVLVVPGALFGQDLPTIKASVGQPVIQELMGGCSMRCAFPWTTTALVPGKAPAVVHTLDNNDSTTFWVDPNMATGTKLQFQFPAKLPAELNGTPFYGFDVANGVVHPLTAFKEYSRVKRARMFYNGKALYYITFADTNRWQHVSFDDIPARQGDIVTLEIVDIYPGSKAPNVALTQVILQGAH